MALNLAALRERVRELIGACDDEILDAEVDRAIDRALRAYSRFQKKTADVSIAAVPGVDRYACPTKALGVIAHSYGPSRDYVPVITGLEGVEVEEWGDLEQASTAMDLILDNYELNMFQDVHPVHFVRLEGGELVLFPPPDEAETVYVRLKVEWTTTDFPEDVNADALDALEYEAAAHAIDVILPRRGSLGPLTVGPQTLQPPKIDHLKESRKEYHQRFLDLVKQFTVVRQ